MLANFFPFQIRITKADRSAVARLKNCVAVLAKCWLPIYDTSLMYAYEASTKYEVSSFDEI